MKRLLGLLLLFSFIFYSCQKETSFETGGASSGLLQSDITGECLPKTVTGVYEVNKPLDPDSNYIEVEVMVLETGTYTIYTDTVNGMHFLASGVFNAPGTNTVKLKGYGTPATVEISNFIVFYDTTYCNVAVTVLPAGAGSQPADFTTDCSVQINGSYVKGTPLDGTNSITVNVNVNGIGTYIIKTDTVNGMSFSASGAFTQTGPATVTLTANPGSVPASTGDATFTFGNPPCNFDITATGPATFSFDCATAQLNGPPLKEGTALTSANTITVGVIVTAPGDYTISDTINGVIFTASGTFTSTASGQTITLEPVTPTSVPVDPGTHNLPVNSGTASCNIPLTVAPDYGYFPRTVGSSWSYEFGGVTDDSLLTLATNFKRIVSTNSFNVFARTPDASQGYDTSNSFRKSGGSYYRWQNLKYYLGFDDPQFAEFIFLKDDQPVNTSWTTSAFSGIITAGGTPYSVSVKITFKILEKDVPVTVKGVPYPNTIRLEETYEVNVNGTGWQDGTPLYGHYEDYYSRDIGWIMDRAFDDTGAEITASKMELRRYQIAP